MGSVWQLFKDIAKSDSDDEATVPESGDSMSHLDAALQQVHGVPLGTIADAWQPCSMLPFEGTLPSNEDTLKARAESTHCSKNKDPEKVLQILQTWREKWLAGQKRKAQPNEMEKYKETVEALRARAYILYQKEKSEQWGQNTRVSCS
jgi:hypothetical protein